MKLIKLFCFDQCEIKSISLPWLLEVLNESDLGGSKVQLIEFAEDSQMKRLGDSCFRYCRLPLVIVPKHINYVYKNAFIESAIKLVGISEDHCQFEIKNQILLHTTDGFAHRYFGPSADIVIPNEAPVLATSSFSGLYDSQIAVSSVIFEEASQLQRNRS
jgi:hypothetical protein